MNFIAVRTGKGLRPDKRFFYKAQGFQCVEGCRAQYSFYVPNGLPAAFIETHRTLARRICREEHHPDHRPQFEIPFDPNLPG